MYSVCSEGQIKPVGLDKIKHVNSTKATRIQGLLIKRVGPLSEVLKTPMYL